MKRLMKKFVLLTLLLQLCVHVQGITEGPPREPKFGDMFKFDRKLPCTDTTVYSHYAVYVGDTPMEGKKPDEDIFEMTKWDLLQSGCRFSKLKERPTIYNYKDETLPQKSDEEMKAAILDLMRTCGGWRPTNTCEHIATHVRYGQANRQCNQPNTSVELMCKIIKKVADKTNLLKNIFRGRRSKYLRPAAAAAA